VADIVPVELKENNTVAKKLFPLLLGLFIIIADQVTKALVVANIDLYTLHAQFFGDFLQIIHVRNTGAAFSIGSDLPEYIRKISLALLPFNILIVVMIFYFKSDEFTTFQRWSICGITGGGFGNIIDRFLRPEGVVDFISVECFGLFGFERWPTFNIADMSIVICGGLLFISLIKASWTEYKDEKTKKLKENEK